jgi:hypothetical protein
MNTESAGAVERREDERVLRVFRLARLVTKTEEICLVRDISAGGVKVKIFSEKTPGTRVTLDLGDDVPRPGTIMWAYTDLAGISFDEKIDVRRVLSKAPLPGGRQPRGLRLGVQANAFLCVKQQRLACSLVDISQGGTKVRTNGPLENGDVVQLEVSGLDTLHGVVRWAHNDEAGVSFDVPLSYRDLSRWIGDLSRGNI